MVRAARAVLGDAPAELGEDGDQRLASGLAPLEIGDKLMVCSDGLSGVVPVERLQSIIGSIDGLKETCQALIDAANDAGGPDNITVAMLKVNVA